MSDAAHYHLGSFPRVPAHHNKRLDIARPFFAKPVELARLGANFPDRLSNPKVWPRAVHGSGFRDQQSRTEQEPCPETAGIVAASDGVRLDDAEQIKLHARLIGIYAVRSHAMPPGNITEISAEDRRILKAWLASGALAN